ncbi:pyrophosphate--fructose-6-phosphate 1-phosphotransferase [Nocardioides sp. zg-1228]|uniref:pyrophosphate--fructose-6-phosphate 1-phosphotransferase n=1 Tax=Nocardioides sp. zg-1228 TaxID=2763008 RepID=UPI0016432C8F|nr:pyrophosphate--fructose-6-phosphate 1-phosphotransferase [Nocardioides sp. zg-1228]MBC2933500.1 pyrophosphate--fructose-6-phosphate 1-phosphotransferase [Nocardioides sp. zg-1228]QSF56364.1 pyrophosphate--fructose-6-phosphate 1-phosphotransferase [Nocardioides sp. zg-1228]
MPKRVAILTAGGYAPCLSSAVGALIETYDATDPDIELIAYRHGYHGLLTGNSVTVGPEERVGAALLHRFGGSPIGNSRVKLTNDDDCRRRGLIGEGETALEVAAARLQADGVDVLHTIGGDDTNTAAADLAAHLEARGSHLTVVGLPKTIDNDIVPIRQSLGALTAAEETGRFARNVLAEHGSNPRMLIVHEVMGRASGWLTASAARAYMAWHAEQDWLPGIGLDPRTWAIHAVYVPEIHIDLAAEAERLRAVMDETGCVNIFLAEGAGIDDIVADLEATGETVGRDPFGHVKIDTINPGQYFADRFSEAIGAEKTMVQKSGYFSRSAPANETDLALVREMAELAVACALEGRAGVIGHDEDRGDELRAIEFERIAGHKPFDASQQWFTDLLAGIGQA